MFYETYLNFWVLSWQISDIDTAAINLAIAIFQRLADAATPGQFCRLRDFVGCMVVVALAALFVSIYHVFCHLVSGLASRCRVVIHNVFLWPLIARLDSALALLMPITGVISWSLDVRSRDFRLLGRSFLGLGKFTWLLILAA